jgi:serine/threonine-protein kinase HipA
MPVNVATVNLWGQQIGAVSWESRRNIGAFEYTPEFQASGIQLAPAVMPLGPNIFTFPELRKETFFGLPGLLADSLPDKFGNLLINEWLEREGRPKDSFSPVERLCYVGTRGMGALEFEPATNQKNEKSHQVDISHLVKLASQAVAQKDKLNTEFATEDLPNKHALQEIIRVGTSAGGARAKAVIAWNASTNEVRSGQVKAPSGFGYWLLKFDGISGNGDKELDDPQGFGITEYAYYLMAVAAGIEMSECRLFREGGRSHFMTKRFDREEDGSKLFMQSLCALGHYDFNQAGAYSYEQAIEMTNVLDLDDSSREQLFRRAVFNILARNQDDHTKNVGFLMGKDGKWRLAPAFDITYSYNPAGVWTSTHQMTFNGKQDSFSRQDFRSVADRYRLFRGRKLDSILESVDSAIGSWEGYAHTAGVTSTAAKAIETNFRRLASLPAA